MRSRILSEARRRSAVGRGIVALLLAGTAALSGAYAVGRVAPWIASAPTTLQAAAISGTASLSGTVESTAPFKAAQVFIRNIDKGILYTVYTAAGQFRAVALLPGTYEISATTKGLESDVQKRALKAGDNPKLKLALRTSGTSAGRAVVNALETQASGITSVREE